MSDVKGTPVHSSGFVHSTRAFGSYLLGAGSGDGDDDDAVCDAWSIAPKRRGVYNLVQVPWRLERLCALGMCVCADEFLFLFTVLPLRVVLACVRWISGLLSKGVLGVSVGGVIDCVHLSVLICASFVLGMIDISVVYHSIRGQSVVKLYVVFNVMEIFDRLCCSFGVDILDSLGWTTASAVNYWRRKKVNVATGNGQVPAPAPATPLRGVALLTRVVVDYVLTVIYVCAHGSLLLIWVVTLNVAINTQNNSLLTLLVSNNFVELKGAVFKSYRVQNLFQISCADAVERFQLTVFLAVMLVYAEGDRKLVVTWVAIYLCEVVVDWIKHAFVTKFNRIPHRAYEQYAMVIRRDILETQKNSVVRSIGGSGVAKRIGFVSLPLGALVIRMSWGAFSRLPYESVGLGYAILLTVKLTLTIGLLGHASRRLDRRLTGRDRDPDSVARGDDEDWYRSLVNVERYDKS